MNTEKVKDFLDLIINGNYAYPFIKERAAELLKQFSSPSKYITDELEHDFRTDIANELSRQELIDRLCDYDEQNKLLRKELLYLEDTHSHVDIEDERWKFYGYMSAGRDRNVETSDEQIFDWFVNYLKN